MKPIIRSAPSFVRTGSKDFRGKARVWGGGKGWKSGQGKPASELKSTHLRLHRQRNCSGKFSIEKLSRRQLLNNPLNSQQGWYFSIGEIYTIHSYIHLGTCNTHSYIRLFLSQTLLRLFISIIMNEKHSFNFLIEF